MNASVSMSADAPPPPSTEEADPTTTTKSSDPTCSSTPQPDIPIIDLPYEVDEEGKLVSTSSSKWCSVCYWSHSDSLPLTITSGVPFTFACRRVLQRKDLRMQASRCWFCKVGLHLLEAMTENEGLDPEDEDLLYWNVWWTEIGFEFQWNDEYKRKTRRKVSYDPFVPSETPNSYIDDIFPVTRRTITQDSTLDHAKEQSIIWAQGHINNCLRQHKLCNVRHGDESRTYTPTRLIDVSPDGIAPHVKLSESKDLDPEVEYATLSYCWGGYMPECTTTRQTLKRNLDRILWDSLPKTFQDAVEFTRGLGLKYLWIDSMCIIQEDQDDWQQQSGQMFDIYKNSKVTLAALIGKDSKSGLRNTTLEQGTRLVMTFRLGQFTCPLYIRRQHYLAPRNFGSTDPLLTRGWTFQERIISPRLVLFTEREVIYECACEAKCECGTLMMWWNKESIDEDRPKRRIFQAIHSVLEKDMDMGFSRIPEVWREAVTRAYSNLEMTDSGDRLVALGAISEQFQQVRPGAEYLAGLWSDSLLDDLLWAPYYFSELSGTFPPKRHFNLPTWSWASFEGMISYEKTVKVHLIEVVKARCLYAEDNPFGVLKSSTLILRGMMLSCTIKKDQNVYISSSDVCGDSRVRLYCSAFTDFNPDSWLNWPEELEVYLLRLGKDDRGLTHGLVLRLEDCNACPRVFSRLGVMSYGFMRHKDHPEGTLDPHQAFEQRGIVEEIEIR